ncbi:hypothetical protein [Pseudorhodoplanes sp.]|uniref:hypothetical protein n=1 Tax=Pseudorhodoplanes sp. TaxID=1934341 RepID=UPI002C72966F|nr:hypothetical protein [Pseudorhodoplanes sp.]HWV51898.1 hypothetical protein [Pseudorhodoplanes sp.]
MRLLASLSAALTLAAVTNPVLAAPDDARVRLAQAGPPTSGWSTPGAPQAQPGPPTSGWGAPAQGAPAAPSSGWTAPTAPSGGPAASFGPSGPGGRPQRNCMAEIEPLLADAQEKGKAIQKAAATKQQPVVCQAFRNLATAESKVIKYFEDHGAECGVPPDAMKARKGNMAKIVEIRTKVCDTAAAPAKRAPSLSDALGTSRIPSVSTDTPAAKSRGSTFDTLTGNPLTR